MLKPIRLVALFVVLAPLTFAGTASAATISSFTATPLADNFADDGVCSLREMVQIANTDNAAVEDICAVSGTLGDDTIELQVGPYTLGTPIDGTPDINDGDLEVTDSQTLTVLGQGAVNTTIDGGNFDRVFEVTGTGAFTLDSATVQNGSTAENGGGIRSTTSVTLQNARLTSNQTTGGSANGGGIIVSNGGSLTVNGSRVDTNIAGGTGGGIEIFGTGSLVTNGTSAIQGNQAGSAGGGINRQNGTGDITLNTGTVVEDNNAVFAGGGISHNSGGADSDLSVAGAFVQGNDVVASGAGASSGGGIRFVGADAAQDFTISAGARVGGNTAVGEEATGAGIDALMNAGSFAITNGLVANNITTVADDADNGGIEGGGGITLTGAAQATITGSTIATNQVVVNDTGDEAAAGGILDNGRLRIDSSTINGNTVVGGGQISGSGPIGGGMYAPNPTGPLEVINSTFSSNSTSGAVLGSLGGGLAANTASQPLTVLQSTFSSNSAQFGSGMNIGGGTNFTLRGNLIDEGGNGCFPTTVGDTVDDFNVEDGTSCIGADADADLQAPTLTVEPLADNGGPTFTRALPADSPAIDHVPTGQCLDLALVALTVDQRGFARPEGAACDAGAFEVQDSDGDGILDTADECPNQSGPASNGGCPVPQAGPPATAPTATEHPDCEPLRQRIRTLTRKIKKADDREQKAKLKKKRRRARRQLAALGCP